MSLIKKQIAPGVCAECDECPTVDDDPLCEECGPCDEVDDE